MLSFVRTGLPGQRESDGIWFLIWRLRLQVGHLWRALIGFFPPPASVSRWEGEREIIPHELSLWGWVGFESRLEAALLTMGSGRIFKTPRAVEVLGLQLGRRVRRAEALSLSAIVFG